MSLTSFSKIKRCLIHPYLSEEDVEKLIAHGPVPPKNCSCKKVTYFSGPFGQAHMGEEGSWVDWVFNSIEGEFGTNHINGKPISEADAIQLCAFGEVYEEEEEIKEDCFDKIWSKK